jgi:hypothetical protein
MARPIALVLTIRDDKNHAAQTIINIENQDTVTLADMLEAARLHQINVDAITTGQIIQCGLVLDVPLDETIKTDPETGSDIEEGASFIFAASVGNTKVFIPTFNHDFSLPDRPDVDLSVFEILDFVGDILTGYDGVDIQELRGNTVTDLISAKLDFHRARIWSGL